MDNMQTDINRDASTMNAKNINIRPQINALLSKNGFLTMDDLIAKATALLTPTEKAQFEAVRLERTAPSRLQTQAFSDDCSNQNLRRGEPLFLSALNAIKKFFCS